MYKYYYFAPCKAGLVGGYVLAVLKDVKRLVVKVGTSTLVYDNGKTNIRRMHKLISVLSDIENSGIKVTLVRRDRCRHGKARAPGASEGHPRQAGGVHRRSMRAYVYV